MSKKVINSFDQTYHDLLTDILNNGIHKNDRTGTGTISVFGRMVRFDLNQGFPLLTTKKMFTRGIIHELLWFLAGDTNSKYLIDNNVHIWDDWIYQRYCKICSTDSSEFNKWKKENPDYSLSVYTQNEFIEKIKNDNEFAEKWGDNGPIYSKQWVNWETTKTKYIPAISGPGMDVNITINQIQNVIDQLNNNPDSRRIMLNAWNPGEIDNMTLPPCHYGFQCETHLLTAIEREDYYAKINNFTEQERYEMNPNATDKDVHQIMDNEGIPKRKLNLMWNQRSVDTFLGLPFNIASYAILTHMLAQQTNMVPGELIGVFGDTHIYSNHLEQVKEQLSRTSFEPPKLNINSEVISIFEYGINDFTIENYQSHPAIKAPISV